MNGPWKLKLVDDVICKIMCMCSFIQIFYVTGRWFSPGTPDSSTNKIDRHHIAEILLKAALNTKPWPNCISYSHC
jgi:hypothetical protein